jgi:hypothetical protein
MRAEVTAACIRDRDSTLCFDAAADARFHAGMQDRTVTSRFVGSYAGEGPWKVALYDLTLRQGNQMTEFTLSITLNPEGRIVRVITDSVVPADLPASGQ